VKGFLRGGKESGADAPQRDGRKGGEQDDVADQIPADFTSEELREFLEADGLAVEADPAFKERLRRKLWEMVKQRTGPSEDEEG